MGLGRDRKTPWVHNVSAYQYGRVIDGLKALSGTGESFEVRTFVASLAMPDYQSYLVLSALEDVGLLVSPKRGLMRFIDRDEFSQRAKGVCGTIAARPVIDH
jgi:hypothetical protein